MANTELLKVYDNGKCAWTNILERNSMVLKIDRKYSGGFFTKIIYF